MLLPASGRAQQAVGKTTVLKAARLFDGKSNALVTPGVVVVTDGKIIAVGGMAAVPASAEVIDLGDATLRECSSLCTPSAPRADTATDRMDSAKACLEKRPDPRKA
jgi:hypothetical protein